MLGIRLAGVAFALMATTAFANELPRHRHAHHRAVAQTQPYAAPYQQAWAASSPQRYHESGNTCAPDRAEPVWGTGNALMGYSCVPESANGG